MISPDIQRKPKKKQTNYIKKLNMDNIKYIKSCIKKLDLVQYIIEECQKKNVENIFVVDGPNMGFWKQSTFKSRQSFLMGRNFRNLLIENTTKEHVNLFLIISQKPLEKKENNVMPTCEQMMSFSNVVKHKKQFFINITVACYDQHTDERCMVPNETDDYTRKYISAVLKHTFRQSKKYVPIYEISNDESRNWFIDKKFKVPRIPFPISLLTHKEEKTIIKTKTSNPSSKIILKKEKPTPLLKTVWKKKVPLKWVEKTSVKNNNVIDNFPTTTPLLTRRPLYTHINMPSGTAQQFGINPIIAKNLLKKLET